MKKLKIILTAFAVLTVAGVLALKSHNVQGGYLFCSETPGVCTDIVTKYALDDVYGRFLYCCSGVPGDLECIHRVKVSVNE